MTALRVASLLAVLVGFAAPAARATILDACCACVSNNVAQGSGLPDRELRVALFCAEANTPGIPGLTQRCDALSPYVDLVCDPNTPGISCHAQLRADDILCPTSGAPVATSAGLGALAFACAALGAFALLRRPRRGE